MKVENKNLVKESKKVDTKRKRRIVMFFIIVAIMVVSSINMVSAAFYMAADNIVKHLLFIIIFFILYLFLGSISTITNGKLSYKVFNNSKVNRTIFFVSIFTLAGMFIGAQLGVPFIKKINGAYGWINLGFCSIQPAEMLKCAFVINLANCLSKAEDRDYSTRDIVITSSIYLAFYGVLILAQRDLGTVIHYILIWAFMLFMTKISKKLIWAITILGSVLVTVVIFIFYMIAQYGGSYKVMRVKSYIDILFFNEFSNDYGYQVKQSVLGFGSGAIFGKGYMNGVQKYCYLPEIHTDFIMATFGEEFGILGMALVVLAIYLLYYLIIQSGRESKNYFAKYLAAGIGGLIITQVIINLFVAVGLLPVFGLPMPFFSYGGSAMVTMGICMGIIQNINVEK